MMKKLRDQSIKLKLVWIIIGSSCIITIFGAAFVVTERMFSLKNDMKNNAILNATLVGQYCVVPLTFGYQREAAEALQHLSSIPSVISAQVYDEQGELFASYSVGTTTNTVVPAYSEEPYAYFRNHQLHVIQDIQYQHRSYGKIALQLSTTHLDKKIKRDMLLVIPSILTLISASFLMAIRLQRIISVPIKKLADTARILAKEHDYSIRVYTDHHDEVGDLYESFNHLCKQIELHEVSRNQAEAEIKALNAHLEQRILERTNELNQINKELQLAKNEAESASLLKSEFLANMSHEIRTPMNAVLGFTEILRKQELDTLKKHYIESIHGAGHALLSLINDILDLSKIEAGKLELSYSATDIRSVASELESIFWNKAEKKGINFSINIDPKVPSMLVMDQTRIRQVLINLISNALKFTDQGFVTVNIDLAHSLSDSASQVDLIMEVRDSGIGIAPESQEKIFNSFEQAKNKKEGGTGLGLAISLRLIKMMNGTIDLESELTKGSSFKVRLPRVEIASEQAIEKGPHQGVENINFSPATILIVDDIDYNRELLSTFLARYPFSFIYATNGLEALSQAQQHQPDLILLDMKMPTMDGYEASKKLKANDLTKDIPVIAVTASALQQDEDQISHLCDGYLRKPVNDIDLIKEIQRHLPYHFSETNTVQPACEKPLEANVPSQPLSDGTSNKLHILMAEDNEINQEIALALLESMAEVTIANNGNEAVELVKQQEFDLVLMDLQMPIMDGLEATRTIRSFNKDLPILAMSADVWMDIKKECERAGMNGHLSKPINLHKLKSALKLG